MIHAIVEWYLSLSMVGQIIVPAFGVAVVALAIYLIRGIISLCRNILRRVNRQHPTAGRRRVDPSLQHGEEDADARPTLRERLDELRREEQREHAAKARERADARRTGGGSDR